MNLNRQRAAHWLSVDFFCHREKGTKATKQARELPAESSLDMNVIKAFRISCFQDEADEQLLLYATFLIRGEQQALSQDLLDSQALS